MPKQRKQKESYYLISYIYSVIAISFSSLAIIYSIGLSNIDDVSKIVSISIFIIAVNVMFYYLDKYMFNKKDN